MSADLSKLPEDCPPLNSYYVYLTGGCNLACKHCWLAPTFQQDSGTGGHLDYELFALAIEEGLPLGLNRIKLTGGEPLLHPDFTRMVDLLKEKELGLTIETNGTLLTRSLTRHLKNKSTLDHISVSLDGAEPATHDAFRGVKGSFEKACHGIRNLVEVGYRPQVIMSLHADNVGEMEALVMLAEGLGAGSIKFNLVQPTGRGEWMTKRGQVLDIQRLIKLGQWVDDYLLKHVSIPVYYNWPMAFYGLKRLVTFNSHTCSIFNIMGILHTGHLAMCGIGVQVSELCYGLLGKDHVADVWTSSPILIDLRKMLPAELEGICRECIFRNWCLGTCVAANYHLSGCLTAPFWFCQMADEAGFFPTSRHRSGQLKKTSAADPSTHLSETVFKTKEERRLSNEV